MFRMELENIVANTVYIKARAGKLIIDLNIFKKNSNNLKLNAIKNKLTVDVTFKLEDGSKVINSEDVVVEAHLPNSQVELIKLNLKQKSKTEIILTGKTWLPLNQLIKLVAKSI